MKTTSFDALVGMSPDSLSPLVSIGIRNERVTAQVEPYSHQPLQEGGRLFARFQIAQSISVVWKEKFEIFVPRTKTPIGRGIILSPISEKVSLRKQKHRVEFLLSLSGVEREMILALVQEAGLRGMMESELLGLAGIPEERLIEISLGLESDGDVRILSFSPLFLLSQTKFDFLFQRILAFLGRYHEKNPSKPGVSRKRLQTRFELHPRILSLALKSLIKQGQIRESGDFVALLNFEMILTPDEEKLLNDLENLYREGRFLSESLDSLSRRFNIRPQKLDRLITFLIDRNKIVQTKEGYILHSTWLDDLIQKIRSSESETLSVAEFKEMTGLSRKFAIPLLELLDQMKVTRRKGASREILFRE